MSTNNVIFSIITVFIFVSVLFVAAVSTPHYGISWDEPDSFFAGVQVMNHWLEDIKGNYKKDNLPEIFSKDFTRRYWHPPTSETQKYDFYNNHPPVTRIFGYLSWSLFKNMTDEAVAMRLSACFMYALMISVIFIWGAERSYFTGLISSIFALTIPRMFAFGHLLTTEVFLAAFWIFTTYAFWRALCLNHMKWHLIGWILFGVSINIKFTALIIPVPIFLTILLRHREQMFKWVYSFPVCIVPAYLMNPTWWHNPVETFFHHYIFISLFRTSYFSPALIYFGDIGSKAPWHYPIVQTLITVPAIILILSLTSIYLAVKKQARFTLIHYVLLNIGIMIILASLPNAPRYDGIRLFIPIFPFLALLAGETATEFFHHLWYLMKKHLSLWVSIFSMVITVLLMSIYQAYQIISYHPFELSYYNEFIGGLSGAYRYGMETTYWKEAVTPKFLNEVNQIVPPKASISMFPVGFPMLRYYLNSGMLRKDINIKLLIDTDYIIWVNRRSSNSGAVFYSLFRKYKPIKEERLKGISLVVLFASKEALKN